MRVFADRVQPRQHSVALPRSPLPARIRSKAGIIILFDINVYASPEAFFAPIGQLSDLEVRDREQLVADLILDDGLVRLMKSVRYNRNRGRGQTEQDGGEIQ